MQTIVPARAVRAAKKASIEQTQCYVAQSKGQSKLYEDISSIKVTGYFHNEDQDHRIYVYRDPKTKIIYNFNPNVDKDYFKDALIRKMDGFESLQGNNVVQVFDKFKLAPQHMKKLTSGLCSVFALNVRKFVNNHLKSGKDINVIVELVKRQWDFF